MISLKVSNYFKSDAIGFIVAYTCATVTTFLLQHAGMSHEIIAIGTFTAKTIGFTAGKILFQKNDILQLVKSIGVTDSFEAVAQIGGHYLLLKYVVLPNYYAYPLAYSIPGIIATGVRWYMDYKSGIMSNGNKPTHKT